ncbi:hypothetical protein R5R35_009196 [Gryllus longicercus]|uniref:Uncharacterized protein n=1 Tax=Gryllus longicercus TaxID=2509291 RepID=A0AAN9V4N9_9ORTH
MLPMDIASVPTLIAPSAHLFSLHDRPLPNVPSVRPLARSAPPSPLARGREAGAGLPGGAVVDSAAAVYRRRSTRPRRVGSRQEPTASDKTATAQRPRARPRWGRPVYTALAAVSPPQQRRPHPPQQRPHPPQQRPHPPQQRPHPPQQRPHPPQQRPHPPQQRPHPPQQRPHPPQQRPHPPQQRPHLLRDGLILPATTSSPPAAAASPPQ